jgi:RNA polymerase sigma-70 factor, ECF subfamily
MDLADAQVFRQAYEDHHARVYAVAFRILADGALAQDVVQDVFLRLWRRPQAFDARRGELATYLRVMARSRALDLWREAQADGRATDRLKLVIATDPETPDDAVARGDARALVRQALRRLPAPQREALVLAYWGGLTADEIARRAAVPLGTAKSRIRLGLARLRSECGDAV